MTNFGPRNITELVMAPDIMGCYLRHAEVLRDGALVVTHFETKPHPRDTPLPPETRLPLEPEDLQGLMNSLWRQGYRPDPKLDNTKAVLAATEKHLSDLRAILFKPGQQEV